MVTPVWSIQVAAQAVRLTLNGKSQARTTPFDLYGFILTRGTFNPVISG
jgi:hypothetical protein